MGTGDADFAAEDSTHPVGRAVLGLVADLIDAITEPLS
jgi:hypothetical protein